LRHLSASDISTCVFSSYSTSIDPLHREHLGLVWLLTQEHSQPRYSLAQSQRNVVSNSSLLCIRNHMDTSHQISNLITPICSSCTYNAYRLGFTRESSRMRSFSGCTESSQSENFLLEAIETTVIRTLTWRSYNQIVICPRQPRPDPIQALFSTATTICNSNLQIVMIIRRYTNWESWNGNALIHVHWNNRNKKYD
jgi:hypothetical protein